MKGRAITTVMEYGFICRVETLCMCEDAGKHKSAKGGMVLERRLLFKDHQGRVAEKNFLLICWQLGCWVGRACREQEWQMVQGRKQGKPELTTVS